MEVGDCSPFCITADYKDQSLNYLIEHLLTLKAL